MDEFLGFIAAVVLAACCFVFMLTVVNLVFALATLVLLAFFPFVVRGIIRGYNEEAESDVLET